MHYHKHKNRERGFSLTELLLVISLIGIFTGISVFAFTGPTEAAASAKTLRNAQAITSLYNNARLAGAEFSSSTKEGIVDELIAGVTGSLIQGSSFQLSAMSEEEKAAALAYVSLDLDLDLMFYEPEGATEPEPEEEDWFLVFEASGWESQALAYIQYMNTSQPEFEWRATLVSEETPPASNPGDHIGAYGLWRVENRPR